MKRFLSIFLCCMFLSFSSSVFAQTVQTSERILWKKRPISIDLSIGQEKIIHFPDDIRYWLSDEFNEKVDVLAANGVLYITARAPFTPSRIRVQGLSDNQIYLLDFVTSISESPVDELIIIRPEAIDNLAKDSEVVQIEQDWRIRLTRYAAQQLYAPERLLNGDAHIKRITTDKDQIIPLIRGNQLQATPIAAWTGGGLTVLAVELRNISEHFFRLSFHASTDEHDLNLSRLIRGDWLTATLQHTTLNRVGTDEDTTTLYLVSKDSTFQLNQLITISENETGVK